LTRSLIGISLILVIREGVERMKKFLAVLVAIAGIVGFSTAGLASCGGHPDVADADSTTVASDGTVLTPIVTDQSGG